MKFNNKHLELRFTHNFFTDNVSIIVFGKSNFTHHTNQFSYEVEKCNEKATLM